MASLTFTEKLGLISEVVEFAEKNHDKLKSKVDLSKLVLELKDKHKKVIEENNKQENLKAQIRQQTNVVNSAMSDAYTSTSGLIGALEGVLKSLDTELAKQVKRLRSKAKRTGVTTPGSNKTTG